LHCPFAAALKFWELLRQNNATSQHIKMKTTAISLILKFCNKQAQVISQDTPPPLFVHHTFTLSEKLNVVDAQVISLERSLTISKTKETLSRIR